MPKRIPDYYEIRHPTVTHGAKAAGTGTRRSFFFTLSEGPAHAREVTTVVLTDAEAIDLYRLLHAAYRGRL